jgi:diguanylate cyclase (GGDEF)-like protein
VGSVLKALRGQYLEQDQDLFAARYGGGEFAVLTQAISRPQAMDLAEVIRGRVQGYNFVIRDPDGSIATTGIKVTVSLGVACQTAKLKKASGETLLRAAQDALAEAKLAGRNRVELG